MSKSKRIRIGSHLWIVKFKTKVLDDDGTRLNGVTLEDDRVIEVDSTLKPSDQGLILFHETLHAALFETGLDELLTPQLEEALVRGLSNTLWPIIHNGNLKLSKPKPP